MITHVPYEWPEQLTRLFRRKPDAIEPEILTPALGAVEGVRACGLCRTDPRWRARQQSPLSGVDGLLTRGSLAPGPAARGRHPQGPQGSRGVDLT